MEEKEQTGLEIIGGLAIISVIVGIIYSVIWIFLTVNELQDRVNTLEYRDSATHYDFFKPILR